MLRYLIKRLLLLIPTLILISILGFALLVNGPIDPVKQLLLESSTGDLNSRQADQLDEQARVWRKKLGLDLPLFYLSLNALSEPDTLHRLPKAQQEIALRLIDRSGNWERVQAYFQELKNTRNTLSRQQAKPEAWAYYNRLRSSYQSEEITRQLNQLSSFIDTRALQQASVQLQKDQGSTWKNYVPVLRFHATNQYHRWLFGDGQTNQGVLRGDFGISMRTQQPVTDLLASKIGWSVLLTLLAVLLAFGISIPLGLRASRNPGGWFDRLSGTGLFLLYAMPSFWVAVLLLMTFANPDVFSILPASGVKPVTGYPEGANWFQKAGITLPFLILPVICYTYGSLAILARILRSNMLEVIGLDFMRTARAKGLSERAVHHKHGFSNALLPLITLLASVFPAAVSGAVVIETIFSIPGLGREIFRAITSQDQPVIVAVFCMTGFFTIIGLLVADLLYTWADPRIRFVKSATA